MTNLYIVDLTSIIKRYSTYTNLYDIYQNYPISRTIAGLLSGCNDYEIIFIDVDRYVRPEIIDRMELDGFEIYLDILSDDLDRLLIEQIGEDYFHMDYRFIDWLDHRSIILEKR